MYYRNHPPRQLKKYVLICFQNIWHFLTDRKVYFCRFRANLPHICTRAFIALKPFNLSSRHLDKTVIYFKLISSHTKRRQQWLRKVKAFFLFLVRLRGANQRYPILYFNLLKFFLTPCVAKVTFVTFCVILGKSRVSLNRRQRFSANWIKTYLLLAPTSACSTFLYYRARQAYVTRNWNKFNPIAMKAQLININSMRKICLNLLMRINREQNQISRTFSPALLLLVFITCGWYCF